MSEMLSNNASTTLNGAITSGATSLVVTSATGFPTSGDFRILIKAEGANTDEICTVTAVSGTTFTISRATEATAGVQTASAHGNGATVSHVLTAGALRNLNTPTGFIGAKAYNSTTQSVSSATETALTLDTEEFDTDGFHSTSSNTSRFTIPAGLGGKYLLNGMSTVDGGLGGDYPIRFRKNGSVSIRGSSHYMVSAAGAASQATAIADLNGGDYIECVVYQSSGGNRNYGDASSEHYKTTVSIVKLDAGRVGQGVGCKAKWASGTLSGTGSYVPVGLNGTDEFDTDGFHDPSTNNSRVTIPTGMGGIYLCIGNFYGHDSTHYSAIRVNGSSIQPQYGVSGDDGISTTSTFLQLAAGDYVELVVNAISSTTVLAANLQVVRIDSNGTGVLASGVANLASTFTTSSDTYVDVTGLSITLTTGARRVLLTGAGYGRAGYGGSGGFLYLGVKVDSGTTATIALEAGGYGEYRQLGFSYITDILTAGSHTFKLQMQRSSGGTQALDEYKFAAQELPDSGATLSLSGNPRHIVAYKAADESISNTTLQDDNDLLFSIAANETWVVTYNLFLSNAADTGDVKIVTVAPSGSTVRYGIHAAASGNTATEGNMKQQSLATGAALSGGVVDSDVVGENFIIFAAYISNGSTAGNVTLQWAQNSTDGTNATVMKAGSFLVADRVA